MITLCAIASGSNGNCYYVGNEHDAILIDAGVPARRILARMRRREIKPETIKAVFISHEHADHASGARIIARRLMVPVFVTQKTYMAMYPNHKPAMPRFFIPGQEIQAGSFHVFPFLKNHDAAEPCAFRIVYKGFHVGVFTDIGIPCERVIHHLSQCHALFLETNYDEKMLWEGSYPPAVKQRIASDHGHLSNDQAFELLKDHADSRLQLVILSHLSAENNKPETALNRFSELAGKISIHLTSRHAPGEVFSMGRKTEQGTLDFSEQ